MANNIEYQTVLESYVNDKKQSLINLMIVSLVSKYACKVPREKFLISQQQNASSNLINRNSEDYLNCHGKVLNTVNSYCKTQFDTAYKCLDKSTNIDSIPSDCVNTFEDVIQCTMKH